MCGRNRDRDLDSVRTSSERRNLHNYLERSEKDELRLKRMWKLKIGKWGSSEMALYETRREHRPQKKSVTSDESVGWSSNLSGKTKTPARKSHKLPHNWRITKNLFRRKISNSTTSNQWIINATREGSCYSESTLDSNSGLTGQSEFPCLMQEIFTILKQWTALEYPKFPVNPWLFRVPEECRAATLDCCKIHGIVWVHLETFLKAHLLEKDNPQLSSTIQGIWHHLLAGGTKYYRKYCGTWKRGETRAAGFVHTCTTLPKRSWNFGSY